MRVSEKKDLGVSMEKRTCSHVVEGNKARGVREVSSMDGTEKDLTVQMYIFFYPQHTDSSHS